MAEQRGNDQEQNERGDRDAAGNAVQDEFTAANDLLARGQDSQRRPESKEMEVQNSNEANMAQVPIQSEQRGPNEGRQPESRGYAQHDGRDVVHRERGMWIPEARGNVYANPGNSRPHGNRPQAIGDEGWGRAGG